MVTQSWETLRSLVKSNIEEPFKTKVETIITLNNLFNEVLLKFSKYLQSQFNIEKITKKLEDWYDLSFGEFVKELNKAIKDSNKERVKNGQQPIKRII